MFPIFTRKLLSGGALAIALTFGAAGGAALITAPAAAKEAAPKLSKPFTAVVGPLQTELGALAKKSDPAAIASARAKLDAAFAAASTPDDKYYAGQFAIQLGTVAKDSALQRKGIETALASGKLPAADVGKFNFYLGSLAFDQKDYATARTSLTTAIAAGYKENDAEVVLSEALIADNQVAQGLTTLNQAIATKKAAGTPAPEAWYRRGLGIAYKAKLLDQAQAFSTALVTDYPTSENWAGAIGVLREVGKYQAQETLDLMRLMHRTGSFAESGDYIEYIQAADARRSPGEVLKIIDMGTKAGKLSTADVFVSESKTQATARLAADKASLPGLERDARAASAPGATVMAGGDAFLSYDDAAKAEAIYQIALTKPGVDANRVLTRLGIAQVDQGKYAEAQGTFAKVQGPRKPIADLWAIHAGQKAKGGA
ncbi:MAG: hypothetical protein V4579_02160 [Pseudomonadota bacterium]